MLITGPRIRELIPHAGAMCLLDVALSWDTERIYCTASSHRDPANPLCRAGRLAAICGVEYAAQAMALHGALTTLEGRKAAGRLASVRELVCNVGYLHDVERDLVIEAAWLLGDESQVIYQFRVSDGSKELISGRAAVVLDAS